MSRNKDRLGNHQVQAADPAPNALHGENEPFSFVVPTEFVELPSQGRFYHEQHPLHNEATIEIKQMTAKEEDMLTSRALLKKGVALDRVFQSLIVDKRIDASSLLVGDRNAIMVAARISGYGNDYTTQITCPQCTTSEEHSFDLFDVGLTPGDVSEELGVQEVGTGVFSVVLPKTKFEVIFRLLSGQDEKALMSQIDNARKKNREENTITRQLRMITLAINGDDSPQAINFFVNNVPSLDAQHLRTAYTLATPNIDLTHYYSCNECGYETDLEVPLTSDFFWPKR